MVSSDFVTHEMNPFAERASTHSRPMIYDDLQPSYMVMLEVVLIAKHSNIRF